MTETTSSARLRRAGANDTAALALLVREYWAFEHIEGFDDARIRAVLARLLAQPSLGCAWIVEDGRRAVGYLVAVYSYSIEHAGLTAEIDEFFLLPEYRRGGIGRRLVETAEAEFQAAGCTNVSFQLGRTNDEARRFYTRCGYEPRDGYELMDKVLTSAK